MPLLKIIYGKNLPYSSRPSRKSYFQRDLGPPNNLSWERKSIFTSKDLVKGANTKLSFVRQGPPKLVFPFSLYGNTIRCRRRPSHTPPNYEPYE